MPMVSEYSYRIVATEQVGEKLYRTQLAVGDLAQELQPGQFVNLRVPGNAAELVRIPLSFAGVDATAGTVELVYAVVGEGTRRLSKLAVGSGDTLLGPCGRGWQFSKLSSSDRVLLVSGGIGVTPIVAAGRALAEAGIAFDAIVAAQTANRIWGVSELEALKARVVVCTDDGSRGIPGLATVALPQMLSERSYTEIWTCGPAPMMAAIARQAREAQLSCQVSLERMMTCGFGACHTCNVALATGGYAFCCTDGPVFDAKEVAW